eukprot:365513-Chlamydomonas_euryale.AAC.4
MHAYASRPEEGWEGWELTRACHGDVTAEQTRRLQREAGCGKRFLVLLAAGCIAAPQPAAACARFGASKIGHARFGPCEITCSLRGMHAASVDRAWRWRGRLLRQAGAVSAHQVVVPRPGV